VKVVRLSFLRTGRLYPQEVFLVLMERSEGNMSLKNPMKLLGKDPGTVLVVEQRLNHYATPGPLLIGVVVQKQEC